MMARRLCLWVALCSLWMLVPAHAQLDAANAPIQVFISRSTEGNTVGQDTLTFVNMLNGETTQAQVYGSSYTLVGRAVLFFDRLNSRVSLATPDGAVRPHPFIQPAPTTRRIDWAVSDDGSLLAWTLTEGTPESLSTITTVANIDGTNPQQVFLDGPRNGIRAAPVAFSPDDATLYMDYQPDVLGDFTPYDEFAGLFAVNLKAGEFAGYLPQEPGCYCGAGFGGGVFLRMALTDDLSGFDLLAFDLMAQTEMLLPSVGLRGYTQGGDVLVSADATRAIYALAQVENFGTPSQLVRSVFVLADLTTQRQQTITQPQTLYLRPIEWTEGNSAVILVSPTRSGTWKLNVETGRLDSIADATYLGTLDAASVSSTSL